ncbi:MAG: DsrE family protein [Gammaproteobacteria bacterium]
MLKLRWLLAVLLGVFLSSAVLAAPPAGIWQNPAIKDAGAMHPLPQAVFQPDKNTIYKVVFSINHPAKGTQDPDGGLEPVARAVNIFASAGVPLDHLKFVAIIYGGATPMVLDDAHYQKQFHKHNPNLAAIRALKAAGVEIAVCGQAVAGFGYQNDWVDPDVKVALSALSTMIILQHQGYVLVPL